MAVPNRRPGRYFSNRALAILRGGRAQRINLAGLVASAIHS